MSHSAPLEADASANNAFHKVPTSVLPAPEQIAARAYQIYEQSGRQPGQCLSNWLQAERELHCEAMFPLHLQSDASPEEDGLSLSDVDDFLDHNVAPPRPLRLTYSGGALGR